MRKINHFGVPTTIPQPGEVYAEGLKVWLTNFNESPNKIEYLRFEEGSWMPELIQKVAHIAYEVDDLAAELKGAKVLVEPMPGGENLTIAFIEEGDIIDIDITNHSMNVRVSDEELSARKAKWQPREPRIKKGYLVRYASLVTSADKGAVLQAPEEKK